MYSALLYGDNIVIIMETAKLPKFKWDELSELNSGHTENEWGLQKKKSAPRTFVFYTVSWDD